MIIQGVRRNKGNYEGYDYDNYLIFVKSGKNDNIPSDVIGDLVDIYKVKAAVFYSVFGVTDKDAGTVRGLDILPVYNRYGKVESVQIRS